MWVGICDMRLSRLLVFEGMRDEGIRAYTPSQNPMQQNLERALIAKRESRRVAFRKRFDTGVVKDVVAVANSGAGVIVFDEGPVDRAVLGDVDFEIVDAVKDSRPVVALIINEGPVPIVMNGIVYVRHGAKSEPATTKDLAGVIDRRISAHRKSWLNAGGASFSRGSRRRCRRRCAIPTVQARRRSASSPIRERPRSA